MFSIPSETTRRVTAVSIGKNQAKLVLSVARIKGQLGQKCVHCVRLTDAVGQSVTPSTPHDCSAVCLPSPSRRRLGVIDLTSADAPTPPPTPTTYYATATQQGQSRARAVISVGLITKHKGGSSREPQALHPCRMGSVRLPEIDSNISGWLADFHLRCARW